MTNCVTASLSPTTHHHHPKLAKLNNRSKLNNGTID